MPKRHEPTPQTRATVRGMAAYGIKHPDIAAVVGVSHGTLRQHYRVELDLGLVQANARVAEGLYAAARLAVRPMYDPEGRPVLDAEGKPVMAIDRYGLTAAIFWLKTRARWHETTRHIGGDQDEPPIRHEATSKLDLSGLDPHERDQLRAILGRRAGGS